MDQAGISHSGISLNDTNIIRNSMDNGYHRAVFLYPKSRWPGAVAAGSHYVPLDKTDSSPHRLVSRGQSRSKGTKTGPHSVSYDPYSDHDCLTHWSDQLPNQEKYRKQQKFYQKRPIRQSQRTVKPASRRQPSPKGTFLRDQVSKTTHRAKPADRQTGQPETAKSQRDVFE